MKKIVSLLLTAVLLCTLLSVFAIPASAEAQTIDGTDITWELSEDGKTLTFTGKGAMPNYDFTTFEDRPWHNAAETVTTVQINPGITALGDYAFYQFIKMTSVTIPDGVTSIGKDAFDHCESLTSVTIPVGVTSIGMSAFGHCQGLTSVTIPASVTSIGVKAFLDCSNLTSVTVKASTPPTLEDDSVFDNTPEPVIYVPYGTSDDYISADNWGSAKISEKIQEAYIVDTKRTELGTVTVDMDSFSVSDFAEGQTVTVSVVPNEGYRLKADSLSVVAENGEAIALTQDETDPMKYSFTMLPANVTVKAAFVEITDESEPAPTATVFSEGNIWIIIAAAVVVIGLGGAAALFIVKKKKKPALAGGENTDEE